MCSPQSPLELSRAAADLPSFQFPAQPDPGIGKPAQRTSAQPEFEPFVSYMGERSSRTRMSGLYALGLSLVLIFAFGGSALLYATRQTQAWMPNVEGYLRELARLGHLPDWKRSELQPAQNRLPAPQAPAAPSAADEKLENIPDRAPVKNDLASVPDNTADTEIQVTPEARDKAADRATKISEKKRAPEQKPPGVRIASDQEIAGRKLEMEVYKAISDRAITGVAIVSVSDGTVYLDGRVATPRQKLAAVRAALSVPGVKSVRDRITIDN